MNDFLFIRLGKEYKRLSFSDIIYIESLKNYVRIITVKASHIILVTMNHVEEVLPKNQFCRVHRCYIVALKFIMGFNHDKVHVPDKSLPISEQYRKLLISHVITLEGEPKVKEGIDNNHSVTFVNLTSNNFK